jgi:uncharacterized protein
MENRIFKITVNNAAHALLLACAMLFLYRAITISLNTVWHFPYIHILYYFIPFLIILAIFILSSFQAVLAAGLSLAAAALLILFYFFDFGFIFFDAIPVIVISCAFLLLYGLTEILSSFYKIRPSYTDAIPYLKIMLSVVLSIIMLLSVGTPLFIRNISRTSLSGYAEATIDLSGEKITIAPIGAAWYFSKTNPIYFDGHAYTSLSWNEIALFGKEPIGFDHKRYGQEYDGTEQSIYYADAQDFEKYNMFRYVNYEGNALTEAVNDFWKLPDIEELVRMQVYRGIIAQGTFSYTDETAYYEISPDKESPLWAKNEMVNAYWTSTEYDGQKAYEVHYSGIVDQIEKTQKDPYRGFRAIRTEKRDSDLIKVEIEGIRIEQATQTPVIILTETRGNRFIAIWIGYAEAYSIALELLDARPPRPLSHDLMVSVIGQLGAKVESIEITEMKNNIYYSIIHLIDKDLETKRIDARPSDAIAIALRAGAEIYVRESLMERMGIEIEDVEEQYREFDEL